VLSLAVIVLSLIVVGITAVSMSAIATNGEIRNGGLYYLVGFFTITLFDEVYWTLEYKTILIF
jgi:hypothetical protein